MTTQLTPPDRQQSYSQKEYAAAFAIAKEALTYVARFQTPPTPDVYEIWYRFAEGSNSALTEQLSFAVNELKLVGRNRIEQLHQEFFARCESVDENADMANSLGIELGGLESMIRTQMSISDDFQTAVSSVAESLPENATAQQVRGCVEAVLATGQMLQNQLGELRSQMEASQANLESLHADFVKSQRSLQTDPLTGVGNRRRFDVLMKKSVEEFSRSKSFRILLLIDLDNFKDINDTFGHSAGDEVLRYVTSEMRRMAPDASITRYGGDEFAVFASCEDADHGLALANAFCEFFAQKRLTMRRTGEALGNVTLSIGIAILRADDSTDSWFDRADKLLYNAKQSGRNRVMAERRLD